MNKEMEYYYVVTFHDPHDHGNECTCAQKLVPGWGPMPYVSPHKHLALKALELARKQDPSITFKLIRFKRDGEELGD